VQLVDSTESVHVWGVPPPRKHANKEIKEGDWKFLQLALLYLPVSSGVLRSSPTIEIKLAAVGPQSGRIRHSADFLEERA